MAESGNGDGKSKTELLDELEKGPWPSFVKEIKAASEGNDACNDLLGQLELSYRGKNGALEARRYCWRARLWRWRDRPLQRCPGTVS